MQTARMSVKDRKYMELAYQVSRNSRPEDKRVHPVVGAVIVKNGKVLATAFRGEMRRGRHAEFVALESKLRDKSVAGATLYTTLEPCTTRNHPKIPCASRIIERKISRVVIGMLDPNKDIRGKGVGMMRNANIEVALAGSEIASKIEEINRNFIRAQNEFCNSVAAHNSKSQNGEIKRQPSPKKASIVHAHGLELFRESPPLLEVLAFAANPNDGVILTYGCAQIEGNPSLYSVEHGDLVALLRANEIASQIAPQERRGFLNAYSLQQSISLHKNIFSVSGPKWNPITAYFLGALGCPATFVKEPPGIAVQTPAMSSSEIYRTSRIEGKLPTLCHGIIVSGQLETHDKKQNIVICAGRTTLSTNATLLFLSRLSRSDKSLRDLRRRGITSGKTWAALVRVESTLSDIPDSPASLLEDGVSVTLSRIFLPVDFRSPYSIQYSKEPMIRSSRAAF